MTELNDLTIHTFRNLKLASPTISQLEQRQHLAQLICQPQTNPAKIHQTHPWTEQHPIKQIPNTRSYSTTVPSSLSPSKRLRPRSPSPSLQDWQSLSSFKHWSAPSPSPSPPPPPAAVQQQGILRKRTIDGKATVGAWSTSSGATLGEGEVERKGKKKKKTVRMESPAGTAIGESSISKMGTRKSPRNVRGVTGTSEGDGSLRRSSRARAKNTKELVPATPDEGGEGREGAKEKDPRVLTKERKQQPELGKGAIKRCIPPPYHHVISHTSPSASTDPTRKDTCAILHSFVDPSYSPPITTTPPSSSRLTTVPPDISQLSPITASFLTPGRQGSWLLPLSSALPIPHTSPPTWFSSPPPLTEPSEPLALLLLEWTDSRLKALWAFLTYFHKTSTFGPLRTSCIISPSSSSSFPDYLKITLDANLALPFRALLSVFSVAGGLKVGSGIAPKKKGGGGGGWSEGLTKEEKTDRDKWMRGRGLVWVDEMGRAVLVA